MKKATLNCPHCRQDFEIEMDISIRAKGSAVFRGRMLFLGNAENTYHLIEYIREHFKKYPKIQKEAVMKKLVEEGGIKPSDADHLINKLKREGFMYEVRRKELMFID